MQVDEERVCRNHGTAVFRKDSRGQFRCLQCRSAAVVKRRDKVKQMALEYKGGACEKCGYCRCSRALEFHHLDPTQKDFAIGNRGETRSWARTKAELDKCILVCANCHREIHDEIDSIPG